MRNLYITFLSLLLLLVGGCRKDFRSIESIPVVFQLIFPDTYNAEARPENIPLSIRNNITGEIKSIRTNASGQVEVELLPGTYSLTASKSYSAEESALLTGYDTESFVNASMANVSIVEPARVDVQLTGSRSGGLVIREFYYAGVPSNYFYDCFIEIYNNSNEEIRVDSLYMGNTKTAGNSVYGFADKLDSVYLAQVFMIPHEGSPRYLQPGESLVLAMDGINHRDDPNGNPNSPVNLGSGVADYETYWHYSDRDTDSPDVPNLLHVHAGSTAGFDWLPGNGGTGLVIFKSGHFEALPTYREPPGTATAQYKAIPVSDVLDGVETALTSDVDLNFKRLPVAIDAGLTAVGARNNGKSVRRKVKTVIDGRTIFVDTNNSSADFEINHTPSPRKWN